MILWLADVWVLFCPIRAREIGKAALMPDASLHDTHKRFPFQNRPAEAEKSKLELLRYCKTQKWQKLVH